MTVLVAVVRLVLAGVFVFSAVAKLRDRAGSRSGVEAFGIPAPLVTPVAAALPIVELACAVLLLLADPFSTVGAATSLVLLAVFTTAIVVNLVQGRRPECHCFGSVGDTRGIGWDTVARNAVFLLLGGVSLVGAGSLRAVPDVLADLSLGDAALLVGAAVLVAVLVAMALTLRTLVQRYGAVLLRLEAIEQASGLSVQQPAPDFRLPDLDGVEVGLDDVLAQGRPALLVFISPTCHNCTELLPDLAAWQADPDHPLTVVVVSDGSVQDNRAKVDGAGPLRVLLQRGRVLADAFQVQGTPAAALVGVDGLVAGPPMHAVDGVRGLHDSIVGAMAAGPAGAGQADHAPHLHTIEPRPVHVGDAAPEAVLMTEDDEEAGLADATGEDAVVVFWRTDCGFCQQILDDVRRLEPATPMVLVSNSPVATLREAGLSSPVLRDPAGALEGWLRIPGTPSAARIRDGVLASEVAVGGPEVLELLRVTSRPGAFIE